MRQTPRNKFPFPEPREEPYYDIVTDGLLQQDAAIWANADNGNLTFWSDATFSWDAPTNLLSWDQPIYLSGFADSFPAFIPAGSVELRNGEVLFFVLPRLLSATTQLTLRRGNRIFLQNQKLHDLRLFAARRGDTVYFPGQLSMQDGEVGPLFGAGLGGGGGGSITQIVSGDASIIIANPLGPIVDIQVNPLAVGTPHIHQPPLVFTPGVGTTGPFNMAFTSPTLEQVDFYRNGLLQREGVGNDYTINLGTGNVTLAYATTLNEVLIFLRRTG